MQRIPGTDGVGAARAALRVEGIEALAEISVVGSVPRTTEFYEPHRLRLN